MTYRQRVAVMPATGTAREPEACAINIIEDVDHIADAATIALAFISGGVAAPALAVKFVVKLGKHRITRVLKKLIE